jgi:hypothetical protein
MTKGRVWHVDVRMDERKDRMCLQCGHSFKSKSAGNRICNPCTLANNLMSDRTPIRRSRG